jgi:LCP family protein required for cell wall assembly
MPVDVPEKPYRVYRSRPRLLARGDLGSPRGRAPRRRLPVPGGRLSKGRFAAGLLVGVLLWLAVSGLAFLAGSVLTRGLPDEGLTAGGPGLTAPTTVLLLGSDARSEETAEPGSGSGPSRADSIMLMRVGGGASSRLSIPRDTLAEIPGRGREKINAAYAYGGTPLMAQTVQNLLGIEVNHVLLVDFERFPGLIDAMGGVNYTGACVVSRINGGFRNGGYTLRLPAGRNRLDGRQALALARTRKNECNAREDDRARARRQQKIVAAMKSRVLSPAGFARLPLIAWQTPRALQSDMSGPSLLAFAVGAIASGGAESRVLPVTAGAGTGLEVDGARAGRAVQRFVRG